MKLELSQWLSPPPLQIGAGGIYWESAFLLLLEFFPRAKC